MPLTANFDALKLKQNSTCTSNSCQQYKIKTFHQWNIFFISIHENVNKYMIFLYIGHSQCDDGKVDNVSHKIFF